MFTHGFTITVERPGALDRFGDRSASTTHTIAGCAAYPVTGSENMTQRDTVIDVWSLLVPFGSDIQATDIITFPGGERFEVDGSPSNYQSPLTGWTPGMEVRIRSVTG